MTIVEQFNEWFALIWEVWGFCNLNGAVLANNSTQFQTIFSFYLSLLFFVIDISVLCGSFFSKITKQIEVFVMSLCKQTKKDNIGTNC